MTAGGGGGFPIDARRPGRRWLYFFCPPYPPLRLAECGCAEAMASTATVLVCLAIPLVFAYRNSMMGSSPPPGTTARTAQHLHLRRRCQHAASGMGIFAGYKWFVTEARAGGGEEALAGKCLQCCSRLIVL